MLCKNQISLKSIYQFSNAENAGKFMVWYKVHIVEIKTFIQEKFILR